MSGGFEGCNDSNALISKSDDDPQNPSFACLANIGPPILLFNSLEPQIEGISENDFLGLIRGYAVVGNVADVRLSQSKFNSSMASPTIQLDWSNPVN